MLLKNAAELKEFSKGEEDLLEKQLLAIKEAGVNVIVAGVCIALVALLPRIKHTIADSKFGDLALHFLNKHKIMGVRLTSKFELRRLCRAVGATALPRLTPPTKQEIGHCDHVYITEVCDQWLLFP